MAQETLQIRLKRDNSTKELYNLKLANYRNNILLNAEDIKLINNKLEIQKSIDEYLILNKEKCKLLICIDLEHKHITEMKLDIINKIIELDNMNLNNDISINNEIKINELTDKLNYEYPENWELNKKNNIQKLEDLEIKINSKFKERVDLEMKQVNFINKINELQYEIYNNKNKIENLTKTILDLNEKVEDFCCYKEDKYKFKI